MRQPGFWSRRPNAPGLAARLLAPLALLGAYTTAQRVRRQPDYVAKVPVISVGNLNVGGTGKTPTVAALVSELRRRGTEAHVIIRGYGGQLKGPLRVDTARHTVDDVGDEALLHAIYAPTWVAANRASGAEAAEAAGAQVLVLDDAHQNPSVAKSFSIVVVDAERGFGNGRVMPSGPLREPVGAGLARADLCLSIGGEGAQTRFKVDWGQTLSCPHMTGELRPVNTGMPWHGLPVLAFAGIAHPEKFFATLRGLGADLRGAVALGDHQPLGPSLLARLEAQARAAGAQLVTTEKDAVRLPVKKRGSFLTVPVRLTFSDPDAIDRTLAALRPPQAGP
ncbi:MAG: tetraacyldisaccharide 4'-kinase [Pseudomonadota bacterium]